MSFYKKLAFLGVSLVLNACMGVAGNNWTDDENLTDDAKRTRSAIMESPVGYTEGWQRGAIPAQIIWGPDAETIKYVQANYKLGDFEKNLYWAPFDNQRVLAEEAIYQKDSTGTGDDLIRRALLKCLEDKNKNLFPAVYIVTDGRELESPNSKKVLKYDLYPGLSPERQMWVRSLFLGEPTQENEATEQVPGGSSLLFLADSDKKETTEQSTSSAAEPAKIEVSKFSAKSSNGAPSNNTLKKIKAKQSAKKKRKKAARRKPPAH